MPAKPTERETLPACAHHLRHRLHKRRSHEFEASKAHLQPQIIQTDHNLVDSTNCSDFPNADDRTRRLDQQHGIRAPADETREVCRFCFRMKIREHENARTAINRSLDFCFCPVMEWVQADKKFAAATNAGDCCKIVPCVVRESRIMPGLTGRFSKTLDVDTDALNPGALRLRGNDLIGCQQR